MPTDNPLLATSVLLLLFQIVASQATQTSTETTDIIVIGGGTAGCAIAARLCALRQDLQVTILERGNPRNATQAHYAECPRQFWNAWSKPYISENFATVTSAETLDRDHIAVAGNTLGGLSALNGRQWTTPLHPTIDSWQIRNLSVESARPYYERAFRTVGFASQEPPFRSHYADAYIKAARIAGFQRSDDPFNDQSEHTMFENRIAVDKDGHNVNSCDAYLTPALGGACANNLKLVQSVTVTKIVLQEEDGEHVATGVEYIGVDHEGTCSAKQTVHARVGVVVSAGPFGSPKLLQLSGIGPRDVLERAGVPLIVDLPTGEKTQARALVPIISQYATELEPTNNSSLFHSPQQMQAWLRKEQSVLGCSPNIANGRAGNDGYISVGTSFSTADLDKKWILSACFHNPKSFGHVRIKSSDPLQPPEADFAFLKNHDDLKPFLNCLPKLIRIHQNFAPEYGVEPILPPDGQITEFYIRKHLIWTGHYVGGCSLGSVVDENLAVKHTKKLRVVDASVFSKIPKSSGPMASVYMLAEYAAEMIAKDW